MLTFIYSLFFIVLLLMIFNSHNLLLLLLLLEMMGFFVMFCFLFMLNPTFVSDFFSLIMFSVFVMEGVLGLFGLVLLVSFTGSDYLSSSSLIRC